MSSLRAFLEPVKAENKEVVVSNRFIEDGKVVPFIIRAITQEENEDIIKKNTHINKKGERNFNNTSYITDMVANAVVYPPLKDKQLQDAYGVIGENKLIKKMLLVGEFANLAQEVQKLSGLDIDVNDEIEEAKN